MQSKVQELEGLNGSLRERDKVKDDAITHLSHQLLALSTRLQELKRKQQTYGILNITLGILSDVSLGSVECEPDLTLLAHPKQVKHSKYTIL